jgi:hypothetical protein
MLIETDGGRGSSSSRVCKGGSRNRSCVWGKSCCGRNNVARRPDASGVVKHSGAGRISEREGTDTRCAVVVSVDPNSVGCRSRTARTDHTVIRDGGVATIVVAETSLIPENKALAHVDSVVEDVTTRCVASC